MKRSIYNSLMKKLFLILSICLSAFLSAQNNPNVDNKFRLAQNYEMAGQLEKAELLYKELISLQSWNYTFFESLNRILILQKKYDESVKLIEAKLKDSPNDPGLYGMLGTAYFISDQTQKAYDSWEKGISANQNSFIAYRIIANAAIENRAFEKAIDYLQRGKKISPDPFPFMLDLANIYAINMNFTDAANELCELIYIRPDQLPTAKSRVSIFLNRPLAAEQTTKAVQNFIDSKETAELFDFLSFVYFQTEKYDKAFNTISEAERKFNGNGTRTIIFAQDAFRGRQFDIAAKAYKYILDHFSKSPLEISARLGYAKTLEEDLNLKCEAKIEKWKPLHTSSVYFAAEYNRIIKAYDEFIVSFKENSSVTEARFRIAEIYRLRLLDLAKADSVYKKVIETSPLTNYTVDSYIARGQIATLRNQLDVAKQYFEEAVKHPRSDPTKSFEAKYQIARIAFWQGKFFEASESLKSATQYLSADFTNDALELSFFINSAKKDSSNLLKFANADLLLLQNNHKQAATEFKTLGDNDNLFVINQFAKFRLAEIFILDNDFSSAVQILEKLSVDEKFAIFAEKSTFLLGNTYLYGLVDLEKSSKSFQKLLENFPNSIYFDHARDELNRIQTKNGQK